MMKIIAELRVTLQNLAAAILVLLEADPIKITSATYTFRAGDDGRKMIEFENANPITATIPDRTTVKFRKGAHLTVWPSGAGQITFTAQNGNVTIVGDPVSMGTNKPMSAVQVDYNKWLIIGGTTV